MFSESFRTRFPESDNTTTADKFGLGERDQKSKDQMKCYADHRRRARAKDLSIGDCVLIRQPTKSKTMPPFDPDPFTVIAVKGSMITVERKGKRITRNASLFKQFNSPTSTPTKNPTWPDETATNELEEDVGPMQGQKPIAPHSRNGTPQLGQDEFQPLPVEEWQPQDPPPVPNSADTPEPRRYPQRVNRRQPSWLQW
jgi:hypothetical protein